MTTRTEDSGLLHRFECRVFPNEETVGKTLLQVEEQFGVKVIGYGSPKDVTSNYIIPENKQIQVTPYCIIQVEGDLQGIVKYTKRVLDTLEEEPRI